MSSGKEASRSPDATVQTKQGLQILQVINFSKAKGKEIRTSVTSHNSPQHRHLGFTGVYEANA